MSENSKIEWTDHTFNPWIGCTKVSPGCDNCYAEAMMDHRLKKVQWGQSASRQRTSPANWKLPLAWNAAHDKFFAQHGRRQRVFCASLADVFDNAVDSAWRADLFRLIEATPNLDWLLLTKRIGNAHQMIGEALITMTGNTDLLPSWPWPNVWLGATITSQAEADRDIPKLLAVPARVRFLSMEPLLGPVDFYASSAAWSDRGYTPWSNGPILQGIHWIIVGGESGPGARPKHPDWTRSLRDQCAAAGVPFQFRQWGEFAPRRITLAEFTNPHPLREGERVVAAGGWLASAPESESFEVMRRVGKKAAGRLLDGVQHDGFPK